MSDLIIIGAGGFGRETLDVVEAINRQNPLWNFLGFIDDSQPNAELLDARNATWLGDRTELRNFQNARYVVGISNPEIRRTLVSLAQSAGLSPATLIHPSVHLGSQTNVGEGSIICAGSSLTTNISIGLHSQLNPGVRIGHDTVLGDFVSIYPGSVIGGNVSIGEEVTVGANVTILQGIIIGKATVVGAGSVVTKDIAQNSVVKGIPAR